MTIPELEFREQRRKGIGGSDAAAIVGMDPWRTALDVYLEKVGEKPEREPTPQMMRGKLLEPLVVELYSKKADRAVRRQPQRVHSDYPFIIGNIDRQILSKVLGDEDIGNVEAETGLLEVKCPNVRMFMRYERQGLPAHIVVQGQHYLGVTGYRWMAFAIFNADLWKLATFTIQRDDAFIASLFEKEREFWQNHVEPRKPPPPVTIALPPPEFEMPDIEPRLVVHRDDQEWLDAAENFKAARELREMAEGVESVAKKQVEELMGEHRCVEGGNLRAYVIPMPGKVSFDREALANAKPLDRLKVGAIIAEWDLSEKRENVAELLLRLGAEADLDLKPFAKTGKPYSQFRPYFLKPDLGEEE